MSVSKFLRELGRPVAYYPQLARAVGSVKATVLLCQLLYWEGKQDSPDGWIYKTQAEIEQETGLTRREQESARETLVKLNLVEEQRRGDYGKMNFRVNLDALDKLWDEWRKAPYAYGGNSQTRMAESAKRHTRKAPNMNGGLRHTPPINTETTTENTHTHRAPARESAGAGVCVSRHSLEVRIAHAERNGLGGGWITESASGRYDDAIDLDLQRMDPAAVDARHRERKPGLMPLPNARDYLRSVLSVGAGTDAAALVEQLYAEEKISEEVKKALLDDLPQLQQRARAPSAV